MSTAETRTKRPRVLPEMVRVADVARELGMAARKPDDPGVAVYWRAAA